MQSYGTKWLLMLVVAVALVFSTVATVEWKKRSPSPGKPVPAFVPPPVGEAPEYSEDLSYPDSFQLQYEYLSQYNITEYEVRPDDTVSEVLERFGLPSGCWFEWEKDCPDYCQRLSRLRPGDKLVIYAARTSGLPVKFAYQPVHGGASFMLRKGGETWQCHKSETETIHLLETATGTITDNLYDSCVRAGLPPALVMELADLFAYDIDFNTDLRQGDSFSVYFEYDVRSGKRVHSGPILGALMTVNRKQYEAFYYRLPDGAEGYYDAQGNSLRRQFLAAPLSYRRISSHFTHRRYHPILKYYRPHLGIDYAAPRGTPVSAIGDGVVSYKGWKGGYGRFIKIRHNGTYQSTYGHLSGYTRNLKQGSKVKMGDVIGYVGSSGLATGPHLDFRFYQSGKPINYLKTKFRRFGQVPKKLKADFMKKRDLYVGVLRASALARQQDPSQPPVTNQ